MNELLLRLMREDDGQDLIEYALLATFVSLVAVIGATALGNALNGWYNAASSQVNTMATSPGVGGGGGGGTP